MSLSLSFRLLRLPLATALCALLPLASQAQDLSAVAGSTASMDTDAMPSMAMPAPASTTTSPPATIPVKPKPAQPATSSGSMDGMHGKHGSMQGMDHGSMQGVDHGSMQGMDHGSIKNMGHGSMHGMTMGPMQGGHPPPDARDPDYSSGVDYGPTHGLDMAMDDNARITLLLVDQLEAFHGKDGNGQQWEIEGWYGNDYDKLWLRTEGDRSGGKLDEGSIETFWNHTIATFWSTQLGVRIDAGEGPNRQWAAFGIQGLAPYWFELEATGYVGPSGRTAARFRAEYELFFTQRLILQPAFEANAYGKSDPARHLGSGLSDASLGLRLRYEFHRQFAPYIGVVWTRRFGSTTDFAREDGQGLFDRQWVAGLRIWF